MAHVIQIESTRAKAGFSRLPSEAAVNDLAITKHGAIEAYVLSPSRYRRLIALDLAGAEPLQRLEAEFHELVAGMQTPEHAAAADRLATDSLENILAGGAGPNAAVPKRSGRAAGR